MTMVNFSVALLLTSFIWSIYSLQEESSCIPSDEKELISCFLKNKANSRLSVMLIPGIKYHIKESIRVTTQYSLDGQGTTMQCVRNNTGIIVSHSAQVTLKNVTISSCGTVQDSSSTNSRTHEMLQFEVAVFINRSSNITLSHVNITNSSGYGLALVNSSTSVTITDSTFEGSHEGTEEHPGGGGVYIEQTEASKGSETSFEIVRSNFTNNNASTGKNRLEEYPLYQDTPTYILFGRGGGLSINLKTQLVKVMVQHCHFENNTAHRGGGLFVFFLDGSRNNTVSVSECNFTSNKCTVQKVPVSVYSAGGGLAVLFLSKTSLNNCTVKHSNFTENVAYYGGGISAGTMKGNEENGIFLIEQSNFANNSAKIGSAMDLFCYSIYDYDHCHCIMTPEIKNVRVERNGGLYRYADNQQDRTSVTIHLEDQKVVFSGEVTITDNQASGVGLENSIMELKSYAAIEVSKNRASKGGGLLVMGDSKVHLSENSTLSILSNMATDKGGGIYVKLTEQFFSLYSYTCFIQYKLENQKDMNRTHPDKWNVNVTFRDNEACEEPSNIFATSVYPCVRPLSGKNLQQEIHDTFCGWKSWHFENKDCNKSIQTRPQSFSQHEYNVSVYPQVLTLIENFATFDDLGNNVTNESQFKASILLPNQTMRDSHEPEVTSEGIRVGNAHYKHGERFQVLIQTAYHRSTSTIVNVVVKKCPLGYEIINKTKGCCECILKTPLIISCNISEMTLTVFIGHCIGYNESSHSLVVSKCPFTATDPLGPIVKAKYPPLEFNANFCDQYQRTGVLCQQCKPGYGINIFSPNYECILCKHSYKNWLTAIGAVIGPQTFFFFFVVIFHIGITAPSMTAYIFFSHVITLPLEIILIKSAWSLNYQTAAHNLNHTNYFVNALTDIVVSPYRIWNFDYPEIFHVKTCLHHDLKIMHAIAFRYLHALYPILLLVTALVLIELHARNCKPIVYLWKPLCFLCVRIRRKWEVKTSVIDAFATVILLSYSKIINTSLGLLTYNYVRNSSYDKIGTRLDYDTSVTYLKGQHIVFASIAVFMLCTFGAIPPLLLLLYPSRLFFKVLAKLRLDQWHGLHMFVETFQGSFKNRTNGSPERRWFAGLYFIFRIIIFFMFAFTEDLIEIHFNLAITYMTFTLLIFLLKPYKRNCFTYLDASFMAILAIVNCSIVYCATYVQIRHSLPRITWHLVYTLMLIPTLYLVVYLIYLLFTRSRSTFIQRCCVSRVRRIRQRTTGYLERTQNVLRQDSSSDYNYSTISDDAPTHSSLDNFSSGPDRLDNPQRYYNMERSNQFDRASVSVVTVDREKDKEELRMRNTTSAP